ncbi:inner centromere protein [Toxorhynchites rutilus septentrionalis]|uniref:inner centromere protein n=1 Tax=Toxorhynchites rutilus septentrionalis TaxID=329112 RepID=UPI00247A63B1|nr:inner centromere protein [Toxorhynchites rutilus septentrionalis]
MDDLMCKFDELILQTIASETKLEEEFRKSTQKLNDHVLQSITTGTPVQSKKRPKRLDSINDNDQDQEHESSTTSGSSSLIGRASHMKNSVHDQQLPAANASCASVPLPVVEKTKEAKEKRSSSARPARSARTKACQNLKEKSVKGKLRQPSIVIKQERISEARKEEDEPMEMDVENDANALNGIEPLEKQKKADRSKSNDEGFGSTNEKEKEPVYPPSREMSIVVVPQPIPKVEVLSDDEDAGKMPPPSMPPPSVPAPKTKGRPKKTEKSKAKTSNVISIKREKDLDEYSSSAVSSAESTISNSSTRSSSRIRKESKVEVGKIRVKTEKLSTGEMENTNRSNVGGKPSSSSPTQSEKSVYEDAIEGDAIMRPLNVVLNKIPVAQENERNQTFAMDKNGTFSVQASNGTFVVPSPTGMANGTFSVKSPENGANATFDVRQLPGVENNTFVMESKKTAQDQRDLSIMTEDNSHIEESPEKPHVPAAKKPPVSKKPSVATKTSSKKKNELFSLQSPIKTRIEAFEKAAVGSPAQMRGGTNKNTTPSQTARLPPKTSTTPLASQRFPSTFKSTGQNTPTTQSTLPPSKGISSSASKLAHLQKKPALASATLTKSQSLSREPSMERLGTLSAASSSSSLAMDEKKKKREEKQRLAQQQREQMEKEKRENAERLLREKEEKHRKLVQEKEEKLRAEQVKKAKKMEEFEKRRHLEELNQRMLAEQRAELLKLEQQQRAEREQAELIKMNQAKESYEIKLHKQMYQQKMQTQQKLQHQAQQQQQLQLQLQMKKNKQSAAEKALFNFDMIQTDDSTDDESTNNKNNKRPPLPSWCSKGERLSAIRIQSEIKLKAIDQFFSVSPMTPDLREIFPAIDSRKLKRNSSAVWRTPPRYSQMPKY